MPSHSNKEQSGQTMRFRLSMMGVGSYLCTLIVVLVCYCLGYLPGWTVVFYFGFVVVINLVFLGLVQCGINLRFSRPDMALEQVLVSIIPGLLAFYFVESPLGRGALLLHALMPFTFGMLGLTMRLTAVVGLLITLALAGTYGALWWFAPERLDPAGDSILMLAFVLAMLQVSLMGGFIRSLYRTIAQANKKLNEANRTIGELASRDDLTAIYNRRHLLKVLRGEAERNQRRGDRFSLAIIDIDYFKSINDDFGHAVGDQVLVRVAEVISQRVRRSDVFGRFGGEEFLLIMPDTELSGALQKIESLREQVAALDVSALGCSRTVTFSAGVASYISGEAASETIKRADRALYQAKDGGRNRVVSALLPAPEESLELLPK